MFLEYSDTKLTLVRVQCRCDSHKEEFSYHYATKIYLHSIGSLDIGDCYIPSVQTVNMSLSRALSFFQPICSVSSLPPTLPYCNTLPYRTPSFSFYFLFSLILTSPSHSHFLPVPAWMMMAYLRRLKPSPPPPSL
jgi:hypothetical protein